MISKYVALDYGQVCTVKQGTWIFEPMFSVECSNIEPEPYHADTPLRAAICGWLADKKVETATLTLDGGEPVSMLDGRFGVFMLPGRVVVPENGVFGGTPGEIMRYGGHGFVAWIRPLPVGEHTIHTSVIGDLEGLPFDFDSTIIVTP